MRLSDERKIKQIGILTYIKQSPKTKSALLQRAFL